MTLAEHKATEYLKGCMAKVETSYAAYKKAEEENMDESLESLAGNLRLAASCALHFKRARGQARKRSKE